MEAGAKGTWAQAMWWDDAYQAVTQPVSVPTGRKAASAAKGSPVRVSARALWSDLEAGCSACGAAGPGVQLAPARTAKRRARRT